MWWPAILLGWPAILGSLLASVIGILLRRPAWLIAGAIISTGFAWIYLFLFWPMLRGVALVLPFLHVAAAVAVRYKSRWLPWVCLVPQTGIAIFLGALVLSQ